MLCLFTQLSRSAVIAPDSNRVALHRRVSNAYCQQNIPGNIGSQWYSPPPSQPPHGPSPNLLQSDCESALQTLKDQKVKQYGDRNLGFSQRPQPFASELVPLIFDALADPTTPNIAGGNCTLAIFIRGMAALQQPDIVRAYPSPAQGLKSEDEAMYPQLVEAAKQVISDCVGGEGAKGQAGWAGWMWAGAHNSIAVAFWERGSRMDGWLRGVLAEEMNQEGRGIAKVEVS